MSLPILIADDDPDIRMLIGIAVRKSGHHVSFEAADGVEAVRGATAAVPALAILDISMPNMTGVQACTLMRADPRLAGMKIVLLSAAAHDSAVQAGLEAGADLYVTKPFSPRALALTITDLLDAP